MNVRNIVVAAVMVAQAIASPRADIIEQVLVKVNGEIITNCSSRPRNPTLFPEDAPDDA